MSVSRRDFLPAFVAYAFCFCLAGSLKAGKIPSGGRSSQAACTGAGLTAHLPKRASVLKTISGGDGLAKVAPNFTSCAVVGNSGMLQATRYGQVIDSHNVVIRLNQAPTLGYERHVGGRATFRIINKEWVRSYTKDVKWLPKEEGLSLISRGDGEIRVSRGKFTCAVCMEPFKQQAAKWSAKRKIPLLKFAAATIANAWRMVAAYVPCSPVSTKKCPTCKASSGMLAVSMALSLCKHVSIYGVAGTRKSGEHPYHYYKFKGTELKKGYSGHMFEVERELINQLAKDRFLTMCDVEDAVHCDSPSWRQSSCCQRESALEPEHNHPPAVQIQPSLGAESMALHTPEAQKSHMEGIENVVMPSVEVIDKVPSPSPSPVPLMAEPPRGVEQAGRQSGAGVAVAVGRFFSLYKSAGNKISEPVDKVYGWGDVLEDDLHQAVPVITEDPLWY